jgi:hypothetical protein
MKNTCKLINGVLGEVWVEAQKEHTNFGVKGESKEICRLPSNMCDY